MNGAFTPEPKNLEPDNSCESGFCRDQREKKPRANLLRSFKEEEVRAFCCYSEVGRNCSTEKWHHYQDFNHNLLHILSNITRLKQLTFIYQEIQRKISGQYSCMQYTCFLSCGCDADSKVRSVGLCVIPPPAGKIWSLLFGCSFISISVI